MDPIAMGDSNDVSNSDGLSSSDGVWDDLRLAWLHPHRAPGLPTRHVEPLR